MSEERQQQDRATPSAGSAFERDDPDSHADSDALRQSHVLEASERLVTADSLDSVVKVLRDTARAAIGAEGVAVILRDGDRCSYVAEDAVAPLWQGQSFPADDCVSGWAMRERQTLAISDVRLDPRVPQHAYAQTFVRSLVMAPIGRPTPIAAIGAYWSTVAEHDGATIERLESLARLATIAIENARLAEARDQAAALGKAQNRILELAVEEAPLRSTLEAIVREVEGLSATGLLGSILLLDEDGTHLRHGAGPSLPSAYNDAIDGVAVGAAVGSCGSAVFRKEPVFVADIATDPLWTDFRDLALEHGLGACWSIPIASPQGQTLGTFAMYYREPRQPNASDLEIVDFVVRTAGLVIARARTEDSLRGSEARLRFFGEMEDRLFGAADATEAMQFAAEMLGRRLGASRCAYADVDADSDSFWIRSDYNAPGVESSAGSYSLDLFGARAAHDMRQGRTLVVRDVAGEIAPDDGRAMFQSIGIDAIVCCPLVKDGRLAAMMAVHQDRARDWTLDEISLIREVVERCWAHVQRVGAETRLRESEERLRLAVENAEVGFWDVDIVDDRLIWPARTKAMFGISADVPVTMQDFYDGLHPDDRETTTAAYLAASDPDRRALYDVDYRTIGKEDGVERWVAAKGRGVFDASGRCLRVAGTVLDITARKLAEEALRDLNATLEARVTEAVADREVAHEALRQSQKMEAMGQLTGGVAHDFNNLLTPIVGSLDMLLHKRVGNEREQRLIAGAMQSAERARTLVQRLLAFARRQPLQSMPVDVARLVSGMGDLVESTTGPQIKVVVEVADDLPPAKADPNQLEMALLNLSVNARDAMPDGGTLRISATADSVASNHRSRLVPGDYVRLSVADTGSGMDETTLARAVEPFFSTKGIGKGTGLGLSMVHGLASQLGGALTIQSRQGLGTNVELWLPVSFIVAEEPSTTTRDTADAEHRGTALLVDDEELVRISTASMLSDLGYAVIETASAEEAVRILGSGQAIDVVVTDHLMPGMTGAELAGHVQSAYPALPVLLVSGYAELEGVDADRPRLTKPFRQDELSAMLKALGD
ncbi:GAF domain-containing protein [Sphingomonas sp. Tas61C01]|uniref:GAF domain-containing protein n=1 Tax=Sphingomonas sp. Tas61C01 TaxID=3458297 RepID=UPI00403E414C